MTDTDYEKQCETAAHGWLEKTGLRVGVHIADGDLLSLIETFTTTLEATAKSAREDERERCATVADGWARSPSCLEEHTDDPCCHVRTGAGIADAIRKLNDA